MMMEIIQNTIVDEHGLQVVLTTHSPSTVAFTPPGSLFWIERNQPIRPASNQEIIPRLSDGFFAVQSDSALGFMDLVVENSRKPILFVEGKTDKIILKHAWLKIYSDKPMPFDICDVFDCYFLINLFSRGQIFENYPDQKFLGLLDFDSAFSTAKEKAKTRNWTMTKKDSPHQVYFEIPNRDGTLLTLPVPQFRKDYASYDMSNPYLTIELLFEDELIQDFCKKTIVFGGSTALKFKDSKKMHFTRNVSQFDKDKFQHFKPLFSRLINICNNNE